MSFAVPENLAKDFLAVAEEVAGASARAAEKQERELRARLRAKLGRIVDDYERELEPLILAIARLPEKDGCRFEVKHADFRTSSVSMDVQVICHRRGQQEQYFKIDAFTPHGGEDCFTLQMNPVPRTSPEKPAGSTFADVRPILAWWFASAAPERLPELKEIMLPADVSVALNHDMKASSVLKLKNPQS